MKKLLTVLMVGTFSTAIAAGLDLNYNSYTQSGIYPLASNPITVESNPPIGLAPGTLIVTRPNNGIYPTQVEQTAFYTESGTRTIIYSRNRNESLIWGNWVAAESGSN